MNNNKGSIISKINDMKQNRGVEDPWIPLDSKLGVVLIIAEKEDDTNLSMTDVANGIMIQEGYRKVYMLNIEDVHVKEHTSLYEDKKGIYILHCNDLNIDTFSKVSILYEPELIILACNNNVTVIKDRSDSVRKIKENIMEQKTDK